MKLYPVLIPTLCRYNHFRHCVESLSKNIHADKTEIVIGLDYPPSDKYREGYEKIKAYIPTITGFGKVTVFEHDHNLGANDNFFFLRDYCLSKYDAYIATEDDNEFSPCFLDFINKALEKYHDDPKVLTVCGYSPEICYDQNGKQFYFCYDGCAWGTGFWKHKEQMMQSVWDSTYFEDLLHSLPKTIKLFRKAPSLVVMLIGVMDLNISDCKRAIYNILNHTVQLRPTISLVRNTGCDGSGIHSGNDKGKLSQQPISSEKAIRLIDDVAPANSLACIKYYKTNCVPNTLIGRMKFYIYTIFQYLKYRIMS